VEKILITCIKNPFKPVESRIIKQVEDLPSIRAAVREFFPAPLHSGFDIVVSLTTSTTPSRILTDEEIETIVPTAGDSIVFAAVPHGDGDGGGGKDVVRVVAMLAVVVAAALTQQYWAVPMLGMSAGTVGAIGMGIAAAGAGLLVNAILPAASADSVDSQLASSDYTKSNTYSWEPSSNADQEGSMLPVLYGTHRITPPRMGRYVSTSGNSQYLNLLFAVAEGGPAGIDSITGIEINDNPSSYYSGVSIDSRLGTNDQTAIPYFNDTIVDIAVGTKLSTSAVTRRTVGNATQALGVGIYLPYGLYYANDSGGLDPQVINYQVWHKKVGDASWVLWGTYTIYEVSSSPIRRYHRLDNRSPGQYDMMVLLTADPPTGSRYRNDVYWEYLEEIVYDDFAYPGVALLAVNAIASDELSNSTPRVTCLGSRLTVPVWTGAAYENKAATNPAWASYDILHNDEYGGGVPYSRIIYERFAEWAAWCDEKGYTCNIYFDTMKNLRRALDTIGILGRGNTLQIGSKFTAIYDGDTLPAQSFLFTMGNILRDSFSEEWLPMDDRANQVEVIYYDKELNYAKQTVVIEQDGFDDLGVEVMPAQVDLIGCTDRDMAIRYGKYRLNCNRYITNTSSWNADVDAIHCLPGDLVEVAHDVPQWGYSGRVVSATSNTVLLDREVILEPGKTYKVKAQHLDTDISEELTVEAVAEDTTTDELTLTTTWERIPVQYTQYSFGEEGRVTKFFRISRITRAQDQKRKIVAVEHVSDVNDDSVEVPVIENVSSLTTIAGLSAREIFRKSALGVIESVASLTWRGYARQYWVYQASSASGPWTLVGSTTNRWYETAPLLKEGARYYFCVTPNKTIEGGIVTSLYVYGKTLAPNDVQNFCGNPAQGGIQFSWDKVPDIDIDYYLLKFSEDTDDTWNTMTDTGLRVYGTSITLPAAMSGKYGIKAVDLNDPPNESENAAYIITDIPTILKWNAYEESVEEPAFSGTKTNLVVVDGTLQLDSDGSFDDVVDFDGIGNFNTLDTPRYLEGYYELPVLDLGSVQTARCSGVIGFMGIDTTQQFDSIPDFDAIENFDGDTAGISLQPQIALSSDGAVYSDWMAFQIGDYTARYIRRRIKLTTRNETQNIIITKIHFMTDMPDRRESGQDVTCTTSGLTATFAIPFMAKPKIGITIQGAQAGDYYDLPSAHITTTGFTVATKNGDANVERTIDWEAAGY